MDSVDVVIIGAGISGIGAAVHLRERCPNKSFVMLERRPQIGGTWDLFRYPGVRSDSDMYTLGFRFKPWLHDKAIADGPTIREYLHETVKEHDLEPKIRFEHHAVSASWSSETATWTLDLRVGPDQQTQQMTCSFLFMCGGYYNYDKGYTPDFENATAFTGTVVHPQHWPKELDYTGKNVVVIGSGATAVTLVPAMVEEGAGHVTMLQRSPTYVVARPAKDAIALRLRKILPKKAAYSVTRWKNILLGRFFYNLAKTKPGKVKANILKGVSEALGPDYDVAKHFTPTYNPWDQRLCLVPDGDLFKVIKSGQAEVVTDTIERFTETGILLTSGRELAADLIVTATGLNLQMLAGLEVTVDGTRVEPGDSVLHKGILLSGIPNMAMWFGYTNASWTLKADLTSEYVCRMLNHMDAQNTPIVRALFNGSADQLDEFVDFTSGYFQRAKHLLPKQGTELPWRLNQNYLADLKMLRDGNLADAGLEFGTPRRVAATVAP